MWRGSFLKKLGRSDSQETYLNESVLFLLSCDHRLTLYLPYTTLRREQGQIYPSTFVFLTEFDCSSPCAQEPAAGPSPQPDECSHYPSFLSCYPV